MMPWPPLAITAECRHLSEVAAGQTHGHGRRLLPSGQKDTNHFNAGFAGVMMIQRKSHLPDSGREFSRPSYPCVEMLIRGQPGHCSL